MDHFFQIGVVGPPADPMLEGYTTLAYAGRLAELGVHHAIFSAPNAPAVVDLLGEAASQVRGG